MKKLLLLLLCVPLIGFGQNKNYTNEEISLLLKLNLCITDSNNNPDNLPICYDDDYSIYSLKDYLVVFVEGRKNYGEWCGSMGCAIISNTFDPFCIIQLPIDKHSTLNKCLHEFTKQEELKDGELWNCEVCNKNKSAKKKVVIWKAPNILIIQLKRFIYGKNKIDKLVEYPLENLSLNSL